MITAYRNKKGSNPLEHSLQRYRIPEAERSYQNSGATAPFDEGFSTNLPSHFNHRFGLAVVI